METTEYLMEKYLDSSISLDEKEDLYCRIHDDPQLNRELSLRKEINSMIMDDDVFKLREKLNLARESTHEYETYSIGWFSRNKTRKLFYAAATVTGIALGSWAVFSGGSHVIKPETIYQENFSPYPPVIVYRDGSMDDYDTGFLSTMNLYYGAKYSLAAKRLEKLLDNDPSSVTIKFYLGVTYMQLEEFKKSRELFNEIINGDSFLIEQALWYKGLGYLAEKDIKNAQKTLEDLINLKGQYASKASKLIEQINGE